MTKRITGLRKLAKGQACVRCGADDGTIVHCHYFGPRRHAYGGGMSKKGHDAVGAHLCRICHLHMDCISRDKEDKWINSEQFLHYCALTWIRLIEQGLVKVEKP